MKTRNILLAAAQAAGSLGTVGGAIAQNAMAATACDPAQLPGIQGKAAKYNLTSPVTWTA